MKHKKKLSVLAFFFTLIVSCAKTQAVPENRGIPVKAAAVTERFVGDTVSGFGPLSFITKVDISAEQEGSIKRIYYREGDKVSAGRVVAQLENPQINLAVQRAEDGFSQASAALRLAKARLTAAEYVAEAELLGIDKAEAELAEGRRTLAEQRRKHADTEKFYEAGGMSDEAIRENRFNLEGAEERIRLMERELEIRKVGRRDKDLFSAGLVPEGGFPSEEERASALIRLATFTVRAEYEAAAAQLEAAGRELESAKLAFSGLTVVSPVSGIVGAKYAEEGERLKRDDKLLTLMDTESLYALFVLGESGALRLQKGMRAEVSVDGTGERYEGEVDLVSPQADSQSFTFNVRVLIPVVINEKLKPGMFARTTVITGEDKKRLVLPDRAIVNKKNDEGLVFVIANGSVSERKIIFGESAPDNERVIVSGLALGELAVVDPDTSLKEGSRVIPEK